MNKLKVVFDLDDTLWNLNERACQLTGVDYSKINNFKLHENVLLTDEEKAKMWELYQDPELWRDLPWLEGATEIHELDSDVVEVWLVTNCLNTAVQEFKRSFLSKALHLPEERIILNVTTATSKKMPEDTFIFVDDSPFNLMASKAKYNLIPDRPWNRDYKDANAYRFNTLKDIIAFIRAVTKNYQGECVSG